MRAKNQGFFVEVNISQIDKNRLKTFFVNELMFYNMMVEVFTNRNRLYSEIMARTQQNIVKTLFHSLLKGKNLNDFENMKNENEETVRFHKSVINDPNYDKCYRFIFEKALNSRHLIVSDTKANMTKELFNFYINQANILSDISTKNSSSDFMRVAPSTLSVVETTQKRHVQLSKKAVSWVWDSENNRTILKTPYTTSGIYLNDLNLNEKNGDWNLIIIHQTPGKIPVESTPWVVNFIKTNEVYYLIKYLDMTHPFYGSSFYASLPKVARK